jgi:hypothetical protein
LKSITGTGIFTYTNIVTLNLPSLESITAIGNYGTFENAIINTLNLPSLTNIGYTDGITTTNSNRTFQYLNTNGNPLLLPKLVSIIGNETFYSATTGNLKLSSLTNITGERTFSFVKTGAIDIPLLESISNSYTFYSLNTNGNSLLLPKLTTIIGDYTFAEATTGAIDLPALTEITGNRTFSYLMSSTLTLRTNLKISKPSSTDNFYYCCDNFQGDTFLNLLYSTEDGTTSGTPMTEVTLTLGAEPTSPETAVAGKWRMNAYASQFLTKLKTITLRPAEGMTMPASFTITTGITSWDSLTLSNYTSKVTGLSYTWTKPST